MGLKSGNFYTVKVDLTTWNQARSHSNDPGFPVQPVNTKVLYKHKAPIKKKYYLLLLLLVTSDIYLFNYYYLHVWCCKNTSKPKPKRAMGLVVLLWVFSWKRLRFLVLQFEIPILFFPSGYVLLPSFFVYRSWLGS